MGAHAGTEILPSWCPKVATLGLDPGGGYHRDRILTVGYPKQEPSSAHSGFRYGPRGWRRCLEGGVVFGRAQPSTRCACTGPGHGLGHGLGIEGSRSLKCTCSSEGARGTARGQAQGGSWVRIHLKDNCPTLVKVHTVPLLRWGQDLVPGGSGKRW